MNLHKYVLNQFFCLAVTGLCLTAQCVAPPVTSSVPSFPGKTVYNGLVFTEEGAIPLESGYFRLDVSRNRNFTGTLLIAQRRTGFSGKFNASGTAYVAIKIGTGQYELVGSSWDLDYREIQKLEWTLVLQVTNGLDEVVGQIFSYDRAGWSGIMLGARAGYSAPTNFAPQAGPYTVIFPGSSDSQNGPEGDGYAALTVDKAGNIRLVGALADGSKVTVSSVLCAEGVWPLFMPSDGGRGMLMGWLQFTNSAESELAGELTWARLRHPAARLYAEGFTNQTSILASRYVRPTSNQPVLNLTNAVLVMRGSELGSSFTNSLTLRTRSELRGAGSRLFAKFSTVNGLFLGTAELPETRRTVRLKGAGLQNRNVALGYFTGDSLNGEVTIQELPFSGL